MTVVQNAMPSQFVGRAVPIQNQIKRPAKRSQLLAIQDVLRKIIHDPDSRPFDICQASRAFDVIEDRLRETAGVPPLAPVKQEPKRRQPRQPQILPGSGPYVPPA
jgi:hypothetical protein